MKNLIYIVLSLLFLISCSSGGDEINPFSSLENTIVGKTWKFFDEDFDGHWFQLSENNKYYEKFHLCDSLEQNGVWELDEATLIHTYTVGPLEYIISISFVDFNDSIIKVRVDTLSDVEVNLIYELVEDEVIYGCTDSIASNYNPETNCPIECLYNGCMDETAFNFNPNATSDDGTCCYLAGCTDLLASNYNSSACYDDGSCLYLGCTDENALNYDPTATTDNGMCAYPSTHTYVPDNKFEQGLIDLGYDLVLDDYVLTENIENIISLDLTNRDIDYLLGIEDFQSLESLDLSNSSLIFINNTPLLIDVSNNVNLKYLYLRRNHIDNIDLTNNINLEIFRIFRTSSIS